MTYHPINSFAQQSDPNLPRLPILELHLLLRLLLRLEELQLEKSLPSVMDLGKTKANVAHLEEAVFPRSPPFHLEQHLSNFTLHTVYFLPKKMSKPEEGPSLGAIFRS